MLNLILVGMFTAFFIALMEPVRDLLTIVMSRKVANGFFSVLFSFFGNMLIDHTFNTHMIINVFAGAFFGSFLIILTERIATYQAAVIRAVGQDR